jgi:mono/diheme cytochrome c family protein
MTTRKFLVAAAGAAALVALPFTSFAADGEAIFKTNCVKCHGADGKADTATGKALKAANLTDPKVQGASDADLMGQIKANKKHGTFISKLTDEDLTAVIGYIKTLK